MADSLKNIENAVRQLSEDELQSFRDWFERFDAKKWDDKIKADSESGKLDSLISTAIDEHKAGKTKQL